MENNYFPSSTATATTTTDATTTNSTTTNSSNNTAAAPNSQFQNSLRSLNKSSYKIFKPPARNPNPNPSNPSPNSPPSNPNPSPQSQPPVFNIDKSDFREIVQKLTGSPAHRQPPTSSSSAAAAPAPPPPRPSTTSRLHRIRPPPLSNLSHVVGPPPAEVWARPALSPLPPLPTISAAAESPITAYMRRLRGGPSPMAAAAGAPPLSPLGFGCSGMMLSPSLLMPTSPRMPLPSPRMDARGRGRGRGRRVTRAAAAGGGIPEEPEQAPQYLIDLLTPLIERIGALEDSRATSSHGERHQEDHSAPQGDRLALGTGTPAGGQEDFQAWVKLVDKFQRLKAPEFKGGADPLVADRWKTDVRRTLDLLHTDPIQSHQLAAYNLKGGASQWYLLTFTAEERQTASWDEFVRRFDQQYISPAIRKEKEAELITLEQGDMTVLEYQERFVSLCRFAEGLYTTEERRASAFEKGLRHQIRTHVISQRYGTLQEVVEAARAVETHQAAGQRGRESTQRGGGAGQGKGKRPFIQYQGAPQQGSAGRGGAGRGGCFRCGLTGHIARHCTQQGGGPGRQGGRGAGQGRGQFQRGGRWQGHQRGQQHQHHQQQQGQQQQAYIAGPPPAQGQLQAIAEPQAVTPLQAIQSGPARNSLLLQLVSELVTFVISVN